MRLDNLTLGYKIKALNGIRVYFTAQNLFVITKYKGLDPEVPMDSGDGLNPGCRNLVNFIRRHAHSLLD